MARFRPAVPDASPGPRMVTVRAFSRRDDRHKCPELSEHNGVRTEPDLAPSPVLPRRPVETDEQRNRQGLR